MKTKNQPKLNEKLKQYWVNLPDEMGKNITAHCKKNYISISQYLRQIIIEHEQISESFIKDRSGNGYDLTPKPIKE